MMAAKSPEPFMNIRCEVITIADGLQCTLTEQFPFSLFPRYNQGSNKNKNKKNTIARLVSTRLTWSWLIMSILLRDLFLITYLTATRKLPENIHMFADSTAQPHYLLRGRAGMCV